MENAAPSSQGSAAAASCHAEVEEEEVKVVIAAAAAATHEETKEEALKSRIRKLKMKMNQARQLNRREVMREGERLGTQEGVEKEHKRQANEDKKKQHAEWEARNAKALEVGAVAGIDSKYLIEQAGESMRKLERRAEKELTNRFSVKDYYNSEGQHRNYERNLKSLPRLNKTAGAVASTTAAVVSEETFHPLMIASISEDDKKTEREGAKRLAKELRRRIEKQHNSKRKIEFEEADVSYINQRNKRFNEKISRNFDKHTAEIRQNLERGTAL